MSTRVPLPNDRWVRSPVMPEWAICLDNTSTFYGWKVYECNGQWVSGSALKASEIQSALGKQSLKKYWTLFSELLESAHKGAEG